MLTFNSGVNRDSTWRRGEYVLDYIHKAHVSGYSGIYFLSVPAADVEAGRPCEIKVGHISGKGNAWFRLMGFRDTIRYEQLD